MNTLLTVKELEEKLNVSRATITLLRKDGLPFIRIGRSVRFDLEEVRMWIKQEQEKEE